MSGQMFNFKKNKYITHTDYNLKIGDKTIIFSIFKYDRKIPLKKMFFDTGYLFGIRMRGIHIGKVSLIFIY